MSVFGLSDYWSNPTIILPDGTLQKDIFYISEKPVKIEFDDRLNITNFVEIHTPDSPEQLEKLDVEKVN